MILAITSTLFCIITIKFLITLANLARHRVHITPKASLNRAKWPTVSIIIPARNEEDNIETSLSSLMKQNYPKDKFEIIVVDDFSTDSTRAVVDRLIETSSVNVRCITGRKLPPNWLGKSNACMVGSQQATGEYLYFIDADTHSDPLMLQSVVDFASRHKTDLLSFNPRQAFTSTVEKITLPGIFLSIASYMNFKNANDKLKEEAIANGQAMLFTRKSYDAVGGHSAVASEISEDIAFAKLMKTNGFKTFWAFADKLMSTHMYSDLGSIWAGFSKNMNLIVNCQSRLQVLGAFIKTNIIAWAAPVMLLISTHYFIGDPSSINIYSLTINALMLLASIITYLILVKELFIPTRYALTVPFGVSLQSLLILNSYRLAKDNKITWKGRSLS
ncbi:glycosyltransferase [Vibrio pelagius]|uniref:Glycosyltransferase n=1 Tax=Vibrio pelagius TaxID=28169 RepID=A0ABY5GAI7_VIBPE|nr:glycosyltransferase [Vibrio pelagius]UTT86400.1 glycosyltransferase [Vibrio pelagius]